MANLINYCVVGTNQVKETTAEGVRMIPIAHTARIKVVDTVTVEGAQAIPIMEKEINIDR